jgi:hypothetical protein
MSPLLHSKPVVHKYGFVFATSNCSTGLKSGLVLHLQLGQTWASDDPVVVEHEGTGLFSDEPVILCRSTPPETLGELYGR